MKTMFKVGTIDIKIKEEGDVKIDGIETSFEASAVEFIEYAKVVKEMVTEIVTVVKQAIIGDQIEAKPLRPMSYEGTSAPGCGSGISDSELEGQQKFGE
jgi:hypothetical protein